MLRWLIPFSAISLSLGCATGPDDVDTTTAPIVNGTLGGDPAVVVLQNNRNGSLCTGSLIAERVVLTAKHCVQEAFDEGPASPNDIVVGVGDNIRQTTSVLRVASISTTPGIYTTDSRGGVGRDLIGVDVALMVLQSGVPGIEPLPIMRESHATLTGQTITAIGFGQTPSGQVGVKYTTTGRVQGTDGPLIYVGAITCQGDSGGPAITSTGQVAGVVSFGAGGCGTGYGAYNAIYPFLELIDAALTEAGSCLNDGDERCDGADNDCDELVDETCTALGGACDADVTCIGQTCRDTAAGRICTAQCDPLRPDFGCDPGMYCAFSTGCEGFCVPLGDGDRAMAIGTECTADEQCATLFCADPGDGVRRCLSPCRGDGGMCLAGEACAASPGACGGCVAAEIVSGDRGLGEECVEHTDCRSASCFTEAGRSYCTRTCAADGECPSGYHCRDDICVAGPRGDIGDPCLGNGDCAEDTFCASRGAQSWCTRVCGANDCPDGFACVAAGPAMVCAPERGIVGDPCASNDDCVTNLCAIEGTGGECTRMCSADAPCAPGFECRHVADGSSAVCVTPAVPAVEGGCAVTPAGDDAPGLWIAACAALMLMRRRARPA